MLDDRTFEEQISSLIPRGDRTPSSAAVRRAFEQGNSALDAAPPKDRAEVATGAGQPNAPETGPDLINHPPHYLTHPSGVECITITEWFNFNLGNAVKYIWRSADKGATIEDLRKARWYLDREIDRLGRL